MRDVRMRLAKIKRSTKIRLVIVPSLLLLISLIFGLVHHFTRNVWAGLLFYYFAVFGVVAAFIELLLIAFQD